MKQIRAIMLDMDGTLINSHLEVTELTVTQLRRMQQNGVLIGISTGRDVENVRNLLGKWGITDLIDLIVGTGGAELYDHRRNLKTISYPLNGELICNVIDHFKDMDVDFAIPLEGKLYVSADNERIRDLAKADGMDFEVVDFHEFCSVPRPKVMIVCTPEDMGAVVERSKTFSDPNYKSASLVTSRRLYEYMDPRVSKTNGIKTIMEPYGIDMEEICAFGDADNDYDMIKNCGIGVVMANGSEKTKSAADYLTDDNNHDGIGTWLLKYLSGELE